eukprot:9213622-Lingulodinium_polyedra.AAC.1
MDSARTRARRAMTALVKTEEGVTLADACLREARDEVEAADAALARLLAQTTGPEESGPVDLDPQD